MIEDFDACYRAVRSRDTRFDGRIFTAVTSTGIYCRPSCPAQTPKPENVRFYRSAAAAQAAGFRACKRCHPDRLVAPANGHTDLLTEALRLIADGVMDELGVDGLARRLRVTPRHLHRELVARVGAGPLQLARTRRAQTARLLIDRTRMPLTEVAMTAGYASIRQFNDSLREVFGKTPTELRRSGAPGLPGEGPVVLRLPLPAPFDADSVFGFLAPRAIPGLEEAYPRRYRRVVRTGASTGVMEIDAAADRGRVVLRLYLDDLRELDPLVQSARALLDLDADPAAINDVLVSDRALKPLVLRRPGMRVPGAVDGFEMAVRAVLGQQVSVSGATTLASRIVDRFGDPLPRADGGLTHAFPTPERLARADLSRLGLTGRRAATLTALARAVAGGSIDLSREADRERTAAALLALPGVGPWTTAYVAMRALRDPDAIPISDLGIRRALDRLGVAATTSERLARTQAWRPWRAYAAMHLWASLPHTKEEVPT
ncbi:MAG TPA: AlkA N-terminal domain-containing protein [Candidatus Limnocylindrales bacterium]|nr:AlkA N-terminal domain-containing protein [Candidatus Limnocylindrales bacterium]